MEIINSIIDYFATYMEHFKNGFFMFLTVKNVLAVFAGVAIGTLCGAIPGVSITMAVALTLPFTFSMEPLTALSLLMAVYVGAIYGGSFSAILLNTPGTPAATATAIDGFKLSQQGKAGKALHMANWASCVGDLVSTFVVILILPLLGGIALYFKSPEYFALILFSITIIGGVSGKSMIKGLIAGGLGFLVATVGVDPFVGSGRFDFGVLQLTAGFSFVPLLIGLFAIPEIFMQLNRSRQMGGSATISTPTGELNSEDSKLSMAEFLTSLPHMIRGGFIGLFIGIIPGLGATPAAFVSYERARKKSKHPEEFGNGSLEGVAAAEAGNNGVNGSTLVPLLALGIPGDVVTAVMLGAFMIHDLQPGPLMFIQHIDLIFGLFCALIMCDIALRFVGVVFIKHVQKIVTNISTSVIFPAIFVLCVFGSYSINNNMFDVLVMFCFGLVGFIMSVFEISTIPFLIAFVLGPMLEKGLRRSLSISDGDPMIFFSSPIALVFFAMTIATVVSIVRGSSRRRKATANIKAAGNRKKTK